MQGRQPQQALGKGKGKGPGLGWGLAQQSGPRRYRRSPWVEGMGRGFGEGAVVTSAGSGSP